MLQIPKPRCRKKQLGLEMGVDNEDKARAGEGRLSLPTLQGPSRAQLTQAAATGLIARCGCLLSSPVHANRHSADLWQALSRA